MQLGPVVKLISCWYNFKIYGFLILFLPVRSLRPFHFIVFTSGSLCNALRPWTKRSNCKNAHSCFPAGNKHDQDMTSRNRQPNVVGAFLAIVCLFSKCKQPLKLEAVLFIVVLALAWLPNANTNCTTLMLAKWTRVTFQMICCLLVCMYTLCQAQVWLQIGVASLLSLNLPRLQHCNIFLLYRWSLRFQFLNWLAKIAEVQ